MSYPSDVLDPWVLKMREAEDDAARAEALLSAPVLTLLRWKPIFRESCRRAAFDEGVTYLDTLSDTLNSPRHRGNLAGTMPMAGATSHLLGVLHRAGGNHG